MAKAAASPASVSTSTKRPNWRPSPIGASNRPTSKPTTGSISGSTRMTPPRRVRSAMPSAREGKASIKTVARLAMSIIGRGARGRLIGIQGAAASGLGQPHQQRDGDGGGREGDHQAGDDQGLRDRVTIAAGTGRGQGATAALGDDAEQQKDAAAHQVEGEDLTQRAGLADQPIQS